MGATTMADAAARKGRPFVRPDLGPVRARMVRVDDPTWDAALEAAQREGISLAEVIRRALREYADRP